MLIAGENVLDIKDRPNGRSLAVLFALYLLDLAPCAEVVLPVTFLKSPNLCIVGLFRFQALNGFARRSSLDVVGLLTLIELLVSSRNYLIAGNAALGLSPCKLDGILLGRSQLLSSDLSRLDDKAAGL